MSGRARWIAFAVVCVLAVTAAVMAIALHDGPGQGRRATTETVEQVPVAELESQPRIVFRNTAGEGYGRVAMVALDDPAGPRGLTKMACDRVAAIDRETVCLQAKTGVTSSYIATVSRPGEEPLVVERPGIPSRARLSPEGSAMASTAFVAGDSYNSAGFSTRTWITSVETGRGLHVENFDLVHRGKQIEPIDRNFWGVTFLDEDDFFVTVGFGGDTWLARGSVSERSVQTVRRGAECPSVSPDHTRVAYKVRRSDRTWRVAVLDLASGRQQVLPGDRSVDDQVTWLDDDTLVYAVPRTGAESGSADVWSLAADASSPPKMLIPLASSPTVVR